MQKDLIPHDITLKQQYVLNQLVKNEFLYPSQIADMLFCDRPTATVVIRNMERKKWVRREKDTENGKQVRIYITGEGRLKLVSISEGRRQDEKNVIDPLACFSCEEKELLEQLLDKLHKHIKATGAR